MPIPHGHTCTLSLIVALTDLLSISQISTLVGPGLGRDADKILIQPRSFIDIPTDITLPVNTYHSSIRDYVSDPSDCSLPQVRDIASPRALLACSLRLMNTIPKSTALLDALSQLKMQSKAMRPEDPRVLKDSLFVHCGHCQLSFVCRGFEENIHILWVWNLSWGLWMGMPGCRSREDGSGCGLGEDEDG